MNDFIFGSCTAEERELLFDIAGRAQRELFAPSGVDRKVVDIAMDLEAAHSRTPLDFERLRDFEAFDFTHDIGGIYRHLDREAGVLRDHFLPRCALSLSGKFYTSRPVDTDGPDWDHVGSVYVVDGDSVRALAPRLDLVNHSPTGFAWGYGGSGPAQLALAILADANGDDELAVRLHQRFKNARVGQLPRGTWRLSAEEVAGWVDEMLTVDARVDKQVAAAARKP